MSKVRAKFKCDRIVPCVDGVNGHVDLSPVIEGSAENKKFFEYTPSGMISLGIDNEKAVGSFEEGKEYYVDFIPAN